MAFEVFSLSRLAATCVCQMLVTSELLLLKQP
jgi:hypothetical protein